MTLVTLQRVSEQGFRGVAYRGSHTRLQPRCKNGRLQHTLAGLCPRTPGVYRFFSAKGRTGANLILPFAETLVGEAGAG